MTRRMRAVLTACLGAGLAFLPVTVHAQAVYGSVNGTVTDASGAAIPGATVTVTDEAKGTSVTTKSQRIGQLHRGAHDPGPLHREGGDDRLQEL